MAQAIRPTGREVFFDESELIVSKTDLKGRITYANTIFCRVAGYAEREILGQPHSFIRHPEMPRAVFRLLWERVLAGEEIFAYVKNLTKEGDHYWVLAHVTPSFGVAGEIVGFHSNRRVPKRGAVEAVTPLYDALSGIEADHRNGKDALAASARHLTDFLSGRKMSYDELVLAL